MKKPTTIFCLIFFAACGRAHWELTQTDYETGTKYGIIRIDHGPLYESRKKNADKKVRQYCNGDYKPIDETTGAASGTPVFLNQANRSKIPALQGRYRSTYFRFVCTKKSSGSLID